MARLARLLEKETTNLAGDSRDTLPRVLAKIEAAQEPLGFVSIDADHSREGIQRDIHSVLRYTPVKPLYIVMHDSFNPDCRNGMQEANRPANAHVHLLELDFVTGRVAQEEPDGHRETWCVFGLAVLMPERRRGEVIIHANEALLFQAALRHSINWSDNGGTRHISHAN